MSPSAPLDTRPLELERTCAWCRRPLEGLRADAECCSAKCRKRRHRFGSFCVAEERAERPIRLAYFDPPYPGLAHYYEGHRDFGGEVDHGALFDAVRAAAWDGWALSTSSRALPDVLELARARGLEVRVAAWFRYARANPGARSPRQSWEPVIYAAGRADAGAPPDGLVHGVAPRLSDPDRVIGAKPSAFAFWLFALLGARPGDSFHDAFPGSGGVARAWDVFVSRGLPARVDVPARGRTRLLGPGDTCPGPAGDT